MAIRLSFRKSQRSGNSNGSGKSFGIGHDIEEIDQSNVQVLRRASTKSLESVREKIQNQMSKTPSTNTTNSQTVKSVASSKKNQNIADVAAAEGAPWYATKMHLTFPLTATFIRSPKFESSIGVFIIYNCLQIGLQVHLCPPEDSLRPTSGCPETFLEASEIICIVIFIGEFFLRGMFFGFMHHLQSPDRAVDALLVWVTGFLFTLILPYVANTPDQFRTVTVLRVFRLLRVARVARHHMKEMWLLLSGLFGSAKALMSMIVVIVFVNYLFGIVAVVLVGDSPEIAEFRNSGNPKVQTYFSGLDQAMFTLCQVVTGDAWASAIARPVMSVMPGMWFFFVAYIAVASLVLMNLITAIIVENAFEISKKDEEEKLYQLEKAKDKQFRKLGSVFEALDADNSGTIDEEEFDTAISGRPEIADRFRLLGFDDVEILNLFRDLDPGEGELQLEEFISGLRAMQGSAQSKDLIRTQRGVERLHRRMDDVCDVILLLVESMEQNSVRKVGSRLTRTMAKKSESKVFQKSASTTSGSSALPHQSEGGYERHQSGGDEDENLDSAHECKSPTLLDTAKPTTLLNILRRKGKPRLRRTLSSESGFSVSHQPEGGDEGHKASGHEDEEFQSLEPAKSTPVLNLLQRRSQRSKGRKESTRASSAALPRSEARSRNSEVNKDSPRVVALLQGEGEGMAIESLKKEPKPIAKEIKDPGFSSHVDHSFTRLWSNACSETANNSFSTDLQHSFQDLERYVAQTCREKLLEAEESIMQLCGDKMREMEDRVTQACCAEVHRRVKQQVDGQPFDGSRSSLEEKLQAQERRRDCEVNEVSEVANEFSQLACQSQSSANDVQSPLPSGCQGFTLKLQKSANIKVLAMTPFRLPAVGDVAPLSLSRNAETPRGDAAAPEEVKVQQGVTDNLRISAATGLSCDHDSSNAFGKPDKASCNGEQLDAKQFANTQPKNTLAGPRLSWYNDSSQDGPNAFEKPDQPLPDDGQRNLDEPQSELRINSGSSIDADFVFQSLASL